MSGAEARHISLVASSGLLGEARDRSSFDLDGGREVGESVLMRVLASLSGALYGVEYALAILPT